MVEELALNVSPVVVAIVHKVAPLVADRVHVPFPRLSVRVPVPLPLWPLTPVMVTLLLLALKSSVPVKAPVVSPWMVTVVLTVTVPPPDEPSKVTVSAALGTD